MARRIAAARFFQLLCLLAAFLIHIGAGCYMFMVRLIETRLTSQSGPGAVIYSRPYEVHVGQKLTPNALQRRLDRLGYDRNIEDGDGYVRSDSRFYIAQTDLKARQLVIEIRFSDESRVVNISQGPQPLSKVVLKPVFLSNLMGPERLKKRHIRFEDLPRHLIQATLAAEDKDFFTHPGLDVGAIVRALWVNLRHFELRQGGSTLTQQFAKNRFLSSDKYFTRKMAEIMIAIVLENRFSKSEIFEFYANDVYLGQVGTFGIAGFGQGADTFFGKPVQDLTLSESALLAGIIKAPNSNAPYRHPDAARACRDQVLTQMAQHQWITSAEKEAACRKPLGVKPRITKNEAPYFTDYVHEMIKENFADMMQDRSLEIHTTLDITLQQAACEAVQFGMTEVDSLLRDRTPPLHPEAALIAVHPQTGDILAMVGGRDYAESQFNRAVNALRQPGSAFKPFVFAAALQQRATDTLQSSAPTLSSSLLDEPHTFSFENKTYAPGNYHDKYYGEVTVRTALAHSLNVPTVKLAEQVGFDAVAATAQEFFSGETIRPYPSLALGAFEVRLISLAQAYVPFANGGRSMPLHAIASVKRGNQITVLENRARHVLKPEVAFLITSALTSALAEGTGQAVRKREFHLSAAGKTGTATDSWFVGYTPELLCAVWVGIDDAKPLTLSGAQAALPIWTSFMLKAQDAGYLSGSDFPVPDSVVALKIDSKTGDRASFWCTETQTEYYIRGTEPVHVCKSHKWHPLQWVKTALPFF